MHGESKSVEITGAALPVTVKVRALGAVCLSLLTYSFQAPLRTRQCYSCSDFGRQGSKGLVLWWEKTRCLSQGNPWVTNDNQLKQEPQKKDNSSQEHCKYQSSGLPFTLLKVTVYLCGLYAASTIPALMVS